MSGATPPPPGDRRQSKKSSHAGIGGVPVDRRYTAIKERPRSWGGRPLFADDDIRFSLFHQMTRSVGFRQSYRL